MLNSAYYDAAVQVVDQQLGRAGLRLAAVLNRWLGDGAACTGGFTIMPPWSR